MIGREDDSSIKVAMNSVWMAGPFEIAKDQDRHDVRYFVVGTIRVPYVEGRGPLIEGWKADGLEIDLEDEQAMLPIIEMSPDPMQEVELRKRGRPKKKVEEEEKKPEESDKKEDSAGGEPSSSGQAGAGASEEVGEQALLGDGDCPFPQPSVGLLEEDPPQVEVLDEQKNIQNFKQKVEELKQFGTRALTIALPLASRKEKVVTNVVAAMYARLRALGVPVYQLRADRAKEFTSSTFRHWTAMRGINLVLAPGDEPTVNSFVDTEIGILKNATRTLLLSAGLDQKFWPLALRHAGEQRLRGQLRYFGLRYPRLLPFGCKGVARKKTWQNRAIPFKYPKQQVTILGPAADSTMTSGSYWVQDQEGKGFRTTVVSIPRCSPQIGDVKEVNKDDAELRDAVQDDDDLYSPSILATEDARDLEARHLDELELDEIQQMLDAELQVELETEDPGPGEWLALEDGSVEDPPQQPAGQRKPKYRAHGKQPWGALRKTQCMRQCRDCGLLQEARRPQCAFCRPTAAVDEIQDAVGGEMGDGVASGPMTEVEKQMMELEELRDREKINARMVKGLHMVKMETAATDGIGLEELEVQIKSLQVDQLRCETKINEVKAQLPGGDLGGEEQLLQTYTVSNREVRSEASKWLQPLRDELENLISTGTIKKVRRGDIAEMEKSGRPVERLPGKLVATRKAPSGKRKARVVACGNFIERTLGEAEENISAGGADALLLRILIRVAAEKGWQAATTDVKAAFLNAPKRSVGRKVTLVTPPRLLIDLGICNEDELWEICGALYGLRESPADWGVHRDQELMQMKIHFEGKTYKLVQTEEPHLWEVVDNDGHEAEGFLTTYVDDMLIIARPGLAQAVLGQVAKTWTCSPMEVVTKDKMVKFCGLEITESDKGFWLAQTGYTTELVKKHGVEQPWHPGQTLFSNLGTEDEAVIDPKDIRACQGIIGELQWLQKSRPDVCYHVGVMSRLMHRRPKAVLRLGNELLKYLAGTVDYGLHYVRCEEQPPFGENEQLPERRSLNQLEIYTDSSFALEHELYKSITGMTVYLGGAPVLWLSGRQPFVTSSTTEAELLSCGEGFQAGEGLGALLQVIGIKDVSKILLCDSKSGLNLLTTETGSWRTRHLRIRHSKLREAIQHGDQPTWKAKHMSGTLLVADGLTKALQGLRFQEFVKGLKMENMKLKYTTPAAEMGNLQTEDPWAEATPQRKLQALGLLASGAAVVKMATQPKYKALGASVMALGTCWLYKMSKWEQGNELSPPCISREDEPGCMEREKPVMRAPNEPITQEERGRGDEPPQVKRVAVRAQDEPTVERGREDEPPREDPKGHQEKGIGGCPQVQTNLELLKPTVEPSFEMLPHKEGISVVPVVQHCSPEGLDELVSVSKHSGPRELARPKLCMMTQMPVAPKSGEGKPWEAAEFGRPPIGRADHWLMRGEWMVRAHGKSRVQSYSPLHSRTPLPPEELLHDCVVVKFYEGRPEPVIQNRRWLWSVDKDKDHWRGYTFFQRRMTRSIGSSSDAAPTQLDPPTPDEKPSAAVQSVREAMTRSMGSGSQSAHEPLPSSRASHGYRQAGVAEKGRQAVERPVHLGVVSAEQEDPISDWSEVTSDLEEIPPDVKVVKDPKHGAMPYGRGRGKGVKGKFTPGLTDEELRLLQRAERAQMRDDVEELAEERYGPLRGPQHDTSSSSGPSGTSGTGSSSTFTFGPISGSGTGTTSATTSTLVMTSTDGTTESFELDLDEDRSSGSSQDPTLPPRMPVIREETCEKGGYEQGPVDPSARSAGSQAHPGDQLRGVPLAAEDDKKTTLYLVGGGGGGERPPKGKDDKGYGKKGKDQQKGHGKKGKDKGKNDPNTEHFSTGGMHHARGTVSTTSSVVFVPGRGEHRGSTITQTWCGVAGRNFSLALTPDPRAVRAKAAFQLGRVPQGRGVGSTTEVVNVEDKDRERSPRPSSTSKGSGKGKGKQLRGRGPDGQILPPQGDDRADWLTHHTRTGIHHVPVRWDGLGRPHIPDDCGLNLPYLAVINPRNGDLVTWEEDVEEQLLQWCLMQPAVWMSWSDTSDEGSDEGPDYEEEEEDESPAGMNRGVAKI